MSDDILDRLDKDYAPGWKPEPGDKVAGVVVERSQRDGGFGMYPIITVRQDSGAEIAIHASSTVIQNEVTAQDPQPGDQIGVLYQGEKTAKDGRSTYHAYRVIVVKAQENRPHVVVQVAENPAEPRTFDEEPF
jgi:hypothetical protein